MLLVSAMIDDGGLQSADIYRSYATIYQPGLVQVATNWTRNVVYQRV